MTMRVEDVMSMKQLKPILTEAVRASINDLGKLEDVTLEQFKPFAEAVRLLVAEELGTDIAKEANLDYLYVYASYTFYWVGFSDC